MHVFQKNFLKGFFVVPIKQNLIIFFTVTAIALSGCVSPQGTTFDSSILCEGKITSVEQLNPTNYEYTVNCFKGKSPKLILRHNRQAAFKIGETIRVEGLE
jgi:hypothetical protein